DAYRPDRGRVLNEEELRELNTFYRFTNEDENAVAARTLPGVHPHGAYMLRGSGHNKYGGYTEQPHEYQEVVDRLLAKHSAAANYVPLPEMVRASDARIGVITSGGCDPAVREALAVLARQGLAADYLRIRGFPFHKSVTEFIEEHEFCFVVEQNRDAQLRSLLILETPAAKDKLIPVLVYGGFPLSASQVVEGITAKLEVASAVDR
ncbi:MAG TPA: 2-oxoacid:acceptor oxidoreductase subunit alpha, partial [Chloroflexota bacterium]|nr:2-oxoacid:acceptor oxidoreductase subunit alpha [Chloroflexota bacterium]